MESLQRIISASWTFWILIILIIFKFDFDYDKMTERKLWRIQQLTWFFFLIEGNERRFCVSVEWVVGEYADDGCFHQRPGEDPRLRAQLHPSFEKAPW